MPPPSKGVGGACLIHFFGIQRKSWIMPFYYLDEKVTGKALVFYLIIEGSLICFCGCRGMSDNGTGEYNLFSKILRHRW
jgi:hypothetical protein